MGQARRERSVHEELGGASGEGAVRRAQFVQIITVAANTGCCGPLLGEEELPGVVAGGQGDGCKKDLKQGQASGQCWLVSG